MYDERSDCSITVMNESAQWCGFVAKALTSDNFVAFRDNLLRRYADAEDAAYNIIYKRTAQPL